jgi:hypothetical protein
MRVISSEQAEQLVVKFCFLLRGQYVGGWSFCFQRITTESVGRNTFQIPGQRMEQGKILQMLQLVVVRGVDL